MTIPQLSPARLAADTTGARVLDVREPDEVAAGAIPAARTSRWASCPRA
jgi:rhodanese-related sulfurtransferase